MYIIGLTGGIASGKSTAARMLAELGAHVLDADKLGHRAYDPGTAAFDAVVAAFGSDIVAADGTIDRKVLGSKVFGDPDALNRLTAIVWPEIRRLAADAMRAFAAEDPDGVVVLEAAVLFEAGWHHTVDTTWCVIVEPETAIARAMVRDGATREAIEARLGAQMSNAERREKADLIIDNSGDEAALEAQIRSAWRALLAERNA